ncbi:hypothetical protein BDV35DRAFT_360105 [Aspergillus flavus]|uniref:Uncharacterized protein n=2 Tax=Aspergillus subgen. Circumdati TaxID=2720871 RepID=A0A5N6GPM4_ASPFL|nr:hypothetical protein Ao3042_09328 [Aspergillus oryzae 3.042]KAB8244322.1 hypothetical protein BDV35DRAFT_360105 [Aspergillus flavus]KDE84432.1 hypothetical protein AO1008_11082 [Aspergillus oryzae 100-8]|eukprot:EIT74680.1 hypothetical protein Ao3042_09328 [Aspergillus oryzae 3.042]
MDSGRYVSWKGFGKKQTASRPTFACFTEQLSIEMLPFTRTRNERIKRPSSSGNLDCNIFIQFIRSLGPSIRILRRGRNRIARSMENPSTALFDGAIHCNDVHTTEYTVHIIVLLDGAFRFLDSLVCWITFLC